MEGVPLRTIAAILGHGDLRMTARYAHLSPQHLRDAIRPPGPTPGGFADWHYFGTVVEMQDAELL
jgi:hypothetical protein